MNMKFLVPLAVTVWIGVGIMACAALSKYVFAAG